MRRTAVRAVLHWVLCSPTVGLTRVRLLVTPVGRQRPRREVDFLVDSGAVFSVLPQAVWTALGLRPKDEMTFSLADGTSIVRKLSEARFVYQRRDRVSPVILGEAKDEPLLGAVTLETLGLLLNPLSREVQPMRLTLAGAEENKPSAGPGINGVALAS